MVKKALLVGLNYPGSGPSELHGCINDVIHMSECLVNRYGFAEKDIRVLVDTDPDYEQPTGVNIRQALRDLVDSAEPGDYLYFHYSGHGIRLPAETGDDDDTGFDECLVPCDTNYIHDQDLTEIVQKVPDGCMMTIVSDSCCSGGLLQSAKEQIGDSTEFVHPMDEVPGQESVEEQAGEQAEGQDDEQAEGQADEQVEEQDPEGNSNTVKSRFLPLSAVITMLKEKSGRDDVNVGNIRAVLYDLHGKDTSPKFKNFMKVLFRRHQEGRLSRFFSGLAQHVLNIKDNDHEDEAEVENEAEVHAGTKKNISYNGVLVSGCQSYQTSADVPPPEGPYGALTNAILTTIEEHEGEVTNWDIVVRVREKLAERGLSQQPGLYCADEYLHRPFIC